MSAFRFDALPGNAAVSSFLTLIVGAWFLVAAGAILADTRPVAPARPITVGASGCDTGLSTATATVFAASPASGQRA